MRHMFPAEVFDDGLCLLEFTFVKKRGNKLKLGRPMLGIDRKLCKSSTGYLYTMN